MPERSSWRTPGSVRAQQRRLAHPRRRGFAAGHQRVLAHRQRHAGRRLQHGDGAGHGHPWVERLVERPASFDPVRRKSRGRDKGRRIGRQRVAQARDDEAAALPSGVDDDQAGLRVERGQVAIEAALVHVAQAAPHRQQRQHHTGADPPPAVRDRLVAPAKARLEALLQHRPRVVEDRGVAGEPLEVGGLLQVNRLDGALEGETQIVRRRAADDDRQVGVGPMLDQAIELADPEPLQRVLGTAAEGVAREVADRREHARHHVGVLRGDRVGDDVLQQEPGVRVDEEHLLDAVDQRVEQHDLGKRLARAPGRHAATAAPGSTRFVRACG